MAQDVDLGFVPWHELAVHPDLVDLGDRHVDLLRGGVGATGATAMGLQDTGVARASRAKGVEEP
jgi:hypothetical protein